MNKDKPNSSLIITQELVKLSKINVNNTVVHSNSLIKTLGQLDKTPLKILEMIISCIDIKNPPKDNTFYLDKQDIFKLFNVKSEAKYTRFKEHLFNLQRQVLTIEEDDKVTLINLTAVSQWSLKDDENSVKIKLNDEIMPFLLDLKSNFTQYQLMETVKLNSKYSIILFKYLINQVNQGKKEVNITMDVLREMTDTTQTYKMFKDFEIRILKEPLKEINEHTSIKVNYEKIKKGRSINSITFKLSKKAKIDENVFDVEPHINDDEIGIIEDDIKADELIKVNDNQQKTIIDEQLEIKVDEQLYMSEPFILSQTDYNLLIDEYPTNLVNKKIQDTIKQAEKGLIINSPYNYIKQSIINHKEPTLQSNIVKVEKKVIGNTDNWYQSEKREINQEDLKALNKRLSEREEKVLSEEQTEKIKKIFKELKNKPDYKKLNEQEIKTFIYFLEEQFNQKYNDNEKEKLKIEIKKIEEL